MSLTTGGQLEGLCWNTAQGFSTALSSFTGQNYGANQKERIYKGVRYTLLLSLTVGVLGFCLYRFWGEEPLFAHRTRGSCLYRRRYLPKYTSVATDIQYARDYQPGLFLRHPKDLATITHQHHRQPTPHPRCPNLTPHHTRDHHPLVDHRYLLYPQRHRCRSLVSHRPPPQYLKKGTPVVSTTASVLQFLEKLMELYKL